MSDFEIKLRGFLTDSEYRMLDNQTRALGKSKMHRDGYIAQLVAYGLRYVDRTNEKA